MHVFQIRLKPEQVVAKEIKSGGWSRVRPQVELLFHEAIWPCAPDGRVVPPRRRCV
jgi:hypothetical protein